MGSCGLFGFKCKEEREKNSCNSLKGGSPEKKKRRVMWVVGLTDNLILLLVGLNSN